MLIIPKSQNIKYIKLWKIVKIKLNRLRLLTYHIEGLYDLIFFLTVVYSSVFFSEHFENVQRKSKFKNNKDGGVEPRWLRE